jgi:hypothetical protein
MAQRNAVQRRIATYRNVEKPAAGRFGHNAFEHLPWKNEAIATSVFDQTIVVQKIEPVIIPHYE